MVRAKGISSTWITGMSKTYAPPIFHIGISITALYKHKSNTYKTSHKHTHTHYEVYAENPSFQTVQKIRNFPGHHGKTPTNLPTYQPQSSQVKRPRQEAKLRQRTPQLAKGAGGCFKLMDFLPIFWAFSLFLQHVHVLWDFWIILEPCHDYWINDNLPSVVVV